MTESEAAREANEAVETCAKWIHELLHSGKLSVWAAEIDLARHVLADRKAALAAAQLENDMELAQIEDVVRARAKLTSSASLLECIIWALDCRDQAMADTNKYVRRIAARKEKHV